ncbi:apolipoprotein N-acyltransferase [Geovibrio thiophilus]|uniref:Apolipoprotein N-acyltransferase n=2 Tax=Geovibrio thiophilus TaxID=139438 RepID=A0A410JVT8_9BACT|nr:apolipoprotein N-acyltransferase [Geovibrio thiophilus]
MNNKADMNNLFHAAALLFVSVMLLILASPGMDRGFLAWFALVPLFILAEKRYIRPFWAGLLFGEFYYFFGISWLSFPLTDIGSAPLFVSWIVTAVFAAYLGLYYGLTAYVFARSRGSLLFVPVVFAAGEFFRGIFLTGFPWLTLGQTQYLYPELLTVTSFFGEYGLSFLIVTGNLLVYHGIRGRRHILFAAGIFLPVLLYLAGSAMPEPESGGTAKVRMIQTGVAQEEKWDEERKERVISTVQQMLLGSGFKDFDLLVLPETAYPVLVQDDAIIDLTLSTIGEDTPVLIGVMRREENGDERKYYNSAALYAGQGSAVYDKVHLVPFGEYFPMSGLFKAIDDFFFNGAHDYSKGERLSVFDLGKMKIAPMICYEGAFYRQLAAQAAAGANMVVIISNDSWFGFSHGRYQHLAVDVMRAAEFGRWIARCTQSGISAYIDPKGRIKSVMGVGESGYLDYEVNLVQGRTFFGLYGYTWLGTLLFVSLSAALIKRIRRHNKP